MKPERRKKVVSIADATRKDAAAGPWYIKYGNTLLTGVLIAMSVALLVRWRLSSAAAAKQEILNQLHEARTLVDNLRAPDTSGSPADLIRNVQLIETDANSKLSDVLNTSNDPEAKAEALVVRGDLYWQLANLPELPGAASEPTLRLKKTSAELLSQAADAYSSVVNSSDYASAHDAVNAARLGLAAVAENRNDWGGARTQLDAIKADPNASGEKLAAADVQLEMMLANIQDRVYVAPPSGTPTPATAPAVSLPMGPMAPATLPSIPTTMPALPSPSSIGLPPTTRPK